MSGESDANKLAELAQGRLRAKLQELRLALQGRLTAHHRFLLGALLDHLRFLEAQIARLDGRIHEMILPFEPALRLVTTIPGVRQRTAENILAEIGTDMGQFPSEAHLASWAGICPGSNESAGKRKSGKTPKGNGGSAAL